MPPSDANAEVLAQFVRTKPRGEGLAAFLAGPVGVFLTRASYCCKHCNAAIKESIAGSDRDMANMREHLGICAKYRGARAAD